MLSYMDTVSSAEFTLNTPKDAAPNEGWRSDRHESSVSSQVDSFPWIHIPRSLASTWQPYAAYLQDRRKSNSVTCLGQFLLIHDLVELGYW
mmetsp:Transcript_41274/g.162741  ORF Transcript_41274/g.162741 Transcript_41274/m.162741 type:complete len:91 (+) Transcript_41274:3267-3539(+)